MNNNYFIVHGSYGNLYKNWIPWLKKQLSKRKLTCCASKKRKVLWNEGSYHYRNVNPIDYLLTKANVDDRETTPQLIKNSKHYYLIWR